VAYFCYPLLITSGTYDKIDWLAADASLREGGAALVTFVKSWRTVCRFLLSIGSKCERQKKFVKHCCPIGSRDTHIISQPCIAFTGRNKLTPLLHRRNI
jgi:hypothetical protein